MTPSAPNPDGAGTLRRACVPDQQATAHQENDKHYATQHGFVHQRPSLCGVSDVQGRLPRMVAYHRAPLQSLRTPPGLS